VLLGQETASVALHFGADDVNGTLEDERVQHMAGAETPAGLAREQLFRIIRDAARSRSSATRSTTWSGSGTVRASPRDRIHPREGPQRQAARAARRAGAPRRRAAARARRARRRGRLARFPEKVVTFVIDSNPNYTNVCITDCQFCAFYRKPGDPEAYTLTIEEVLAKIESAASRGATTVLLQGGHNPALPLDYYTTLVRETRRRFPEVTPHFLCNLSVSTNATDRVQSARSATHPCGRSGPQCAC